MFDIGYLQVVTLALYTYFVAALMGRQLVPPAPGSTSKYEPDVYFPLFTALQVILLKNKLLLFKLILYLHFCECFKFTTIKINK